MKSIAIKGSKRENVGKKYTKALRDAEKVPCVLYGGSEKVIHFSAMEKNFNNLVYTSDVHTVKLDIDGKKVNAVLQDIQFHPVTDSILHMDFYQFDDDNPIKMTLPIHSIGVPAGVKNGGVLRFNMRRIDVEGLVSELPDYIEIDVSKLGIGDNLYTTAASGDGYEVLHDEDDTICQVIAARDVEALEPELEEEEVPSDVGEDEEGSEEDENTKEEE